MYSDRSYYAVTENPGRQSEWRGQTFDQELLNSYFTACEVKMCPKLAYPVVKSPISSQLYRQSWSQNMTVMVVFKLKIKIMLLSMPTLTINTVWKL